MPQRHRFGRYEVRPDARALLVDGQPAALGARAFDLLLALIERRDRLVTKDELLGVVWSGRVVSENNLHTQISTLRELLGTQAIATIPGRGYRFATKLDDDPASLVSATTSIAPRDSTNAPIDDVQSAGPADDDDASQQPDVTMSGRAAASPAAAAAPEHAGATASLPPPLRFGKVEVHPLERRLLIGGQPAAVGSRAFDLLLMLIESRPRVVTKNELLDRVWPGVVVEENNLQTQVSTLRKLLGTQAIETIPGRGYRFVAALDDEGDAAAVLEPAETGAVPHTPRLTNLPAAAEALFGRGADLEALAALVAEHRLVTVVGAGGIGKTSLAQALARQLLGHYANGVWWVDLASVTSADSIPVAIAQVLNLQLAEGESFALLVRALRSREALLVVDNCEGSIAEVARLVHSILADAPKVHLLATSQEALKAPGEYLYRLGPLEIPPDEATLDVARGYGAVQLLERRARAADRRFSLNIANVGKAIRLCRCLDGIALAIEMVAPRLLLLGFDALDADLGQRLRWLKNNSRVAPARQQTLLATLEWSYSLLSEDEQAVLHRLAVFVGSFRLDSAKAVAAAADLDEWATLDAMAGLIDKSLVQIEQDDPPRYRLLETTRLYAGERLKESGDRDAANQRHGRAMAALADEVSDAYWHMPDAAWLELYAPDYANLEAAFGCACREGEAAVGAATLEALFALDQLRAIFAPIRWHLEAAHSLLATAQGTARARLHLRLGCPYVCRIEGISKLAAAGEAVATLEDSAGDRRRLFEGRLFLAVNLAAGGEFKAAEGAIVAARSLEDARWPPRLRWLATISEAYLHVYRGDAASYACSTRAAISFAEQAGSPCQAVAARSSLADAALMAGEWVEAVSLGERVLAELQTLDLPQMEAMTSLNLCAAQLRCGDFRASADTAERALSLAWDHDLSGYLAAHIALLAARWGHFEQAAQLCGYAEGWFSANQRAIEPNEQSSIRLARDLAEGPLDLKAWRACQAVGTALGDGQAKALAERMLRANSDGLSEPAKTARRYS